MILIDKEGNGKFDQEEGADVSGEKGKGKRRVKAKKKKKKSFANHLQRHIVRSSQIQRERKVRATSRRREKRKNGIRTGDTNPDPSPSAVGGEKEVFPVNRKKEGATYGWKKKGFRSKKWSNSASDKE